MSIPRQPSQCSRSECVAKPHARGLCRSHYAKRWRELQEAPLSRSTSGDPRIRIAEKSRLVEITGCWEWIAAIVNGYGQLKFEGKVWTAHRLSYEAFVGPIPAGATIDHLCRNGWCVNPKHLEPVTVAENNLRSLQARSVRPLEWSESDQIGRAF